MTHYSMGELDIALKVIYGIPYPIKGVMYCTVDRIEPGGLFEQELPCGNTECIVSQDALGDYYEFSQVETNMWPNLGLLVGRQSVTL